MREKGQLKGKAVWRPFLSANMESSPLLLGSPGTTLFARLVAVSASVSGFCFGYDIGIIDSILSMDSFRLYFGTGSAAPDIGGGDSVQPTDDAQHVNGWIVASFLIGCVLGSMAVSVLADAIGRKMSIVIGSILFTAGGVMQTAATGLATLYSGRFVGGTGIGILSMVAPLYISETAETESRGALIATQQLLITIGIFVASCVNSILYTYGNDLGDRQWRAALAAQVVPGILLLLIMVPLPRSPRWLVSQGRVDEAKAVLSRLRGVPATAPIVEKEVDAILKEIEAECGPEAIELIMSGTRKYVPFSAQMRAYFARYGELFFYKPTRRRLVLVCMLQFFQQFTGINVVLYFAADLFERSGVPKQQAATSLVVGNAALLILGTIPGMVLVDRPGVGRRLLLLVGAAAMAVCHVAVTGFVAGADRYADGSAGGDALSYSAVASMMAFTAWFSATWGPTVWIVQSEVLPLRVRAQGTALGTLVNWASNTVIGKCAPLLVEGAGAYSYLVFAGFCVAMFVYVWAAMPETAGVGLEAMDALFTSRESPSVAKGAAPAVRSGPTRYKVIGSGGGGKGGVAAYSMIQMQSPPPAVVASGSAGARMAAVDVADLDEGGDSPSSSSIAAARDGRGTGGNE